MEGFKCLNLPLLCVNFLAALLKEEDMRVDRKVFLVAAVFLITAAFPHVGQSYDISSRLFHSGITVRGHSGLLNTKGGTSVSEGAFFIGLSPDYFDRDLPGGASEQKLTIPLTATYGLPHNIELAGNLTYVSVDNGTSESDLSDVGLSVKWSFLQKEGMSFPSLAAGLSTRLALGDVNKGTSDIDDYALTVFLSGTALIDFGPARDYALSLYGEGAAVFNDPGGDPDEKHGTYSAGVMLPIPPYSDLGFILEFGGTINRGVKSERDILSLTTAFRLNYKSGSFTLGANLINPEVSGEDTYVDYVISAVFNF